jgi:transcriptional regulator with XRE-family HTH domain
MILAYSLNIVKHKFEIFNSIKNFLNKSSTTWYYIRKEKGGFAMSEIVATTAKRLRYAIDYRHTSAAEVSRKTGISRGSLSQYMTGKFSPKQDRIYVLAKHLRVSPAWLMGIDVPMEEAPPPNDLPVHREFGEMAAIQTQKSLNYLTDMLINKQGELYIVTPSEKTLIQEFRKLDYDKKQLLFNMLDTMIKQQVQQKNTTTVEGDDADADTNAH